MQRNPVSTNQLTKGCRNILFTSNDIPVTNTNVGNTSLNKKDRYTHGFTGESGIIKLINSQNAMKITSTTKKGMTSPANSAPKIWLLLSDRIESTSRLSAFFRALDLSQARNTTTKDWNKFKK